MIESGFKKGVSCALPFLLLCFVFAGCGEYGKPFRISQSSLTLKVGESMVLTSNASEEVSWLSDDESVAIAFEDGTVIGIGKGSTSILAVCGSESAQCLVDVIEDYGTDDPDIVKEGYKLIWNDEFDGNLLSADKWGYQLGTRDNYGDSKGPDRWGNNELQYYSEDNVEVRDGSLVITAKKEDEKVGGMSYTSGRITTRGKFCFTYGYVEARIKAPKQDGMWPAFWMLPQPPTTSNSHNEYGGWPRNGEIDIMEIKGRVPGSYGAALHFGDSGGQKDSVGKTVTLSGDIGEWHTYALEWTKDSIAWLCDGKEVLKTKSDCWWTGAVSNEENPSAPFDKPFVVLLNLAVGGNYDKEGTENLLKDDAFSSAAMLVDYVRVYTPIK